MYFSFLIFRVRSHIYILQLTLHGCKGHDGRRLMLILFEVDYFHVKYASVLTRVEILVDLHVAVEPLPEISKRFELIFVIKCDVKHDFRAIFLCNR